MFDFVNNMGDAEIDNYLTDSSATIDRLGLGFFYEICHGSFDERIVTEHKTKASVYADVNKYFLDEEYKRELDRIYAGKTLKNRLAIRRTILWCPMTTMLAWCAIAILSFRCFTKEE